MYEVVTFLEKSKVQYLATHGMDGKPKVRPFQFMFEEDDRLWFCTANHKEVYHELMANPFIELCASGEKMSWMRISGKVNFEDNKKIKEKVFEVSSLVKGIYKNVDNPSFEVFYLDECTASISWIGKAPQIVKF